MVTVNLPHVLRRLTNGRKTIERTGLSINKVIDNLCKSYENLKAHIYYPNGIVKSHILIAVNGEQANLETVLNEADSIKIIIVLAGGLS